MIRYILVLLLLIPSDIMGVAVDWVRGFFIPFFRHR
jgi:hypothetical protein